MHLAQTPRETVYEIKLADLLCSVALEPKTFLKHFFQRNFCRGKKKTNPPYPTTTNPKQQKNLVMSLRVHIIQMRKKERSEERGKKISQGFIRIVTISQF